MEAVDSLVRRSYASSRIRGAAFFEIWVHAGLLCRDATCWIVDKHHFEEFETVFVKVGAQWLGHVALPFGK